MNNVSVPTNNVRITDCAVMAILQFGPSRQGQEPRSSLLPNLWCVVLGLPLPGPAHLFGLHLSAATIRQIIHHAAEGVGVRATAHLLESGQGHCKPFDCDQASIVPMCSPAR